VSTRSTCEWYIVVDGVLGAQFESRHFLRESVCSYHSLSSACTVENFNNCNENVRYEVFTAVTMKKASSGMLHRVALVRTDVLEELSPSIIRVTRIGELRMFTDSYLPDDGGAKFLQNVGFYKSHTA
jgi:hypothetical protein